MEFQQDRESMRMESRVHRKYLLPSLKRGERINRVSSIGSLEEFAGNNSESAIVDDEQLARLGLTTYDSIHELRDYEESNASLSSVEDARSEHKRSKYKQRTSKGCQLSCERGLPTLNANQAKNEAYQQRYTQNLIGGFDPLQLTRGNR